MYVCEGCIAVIHQIFDGTKKVTLDDVQNPLFWIDALRDLLVALVSFIPRLIVAAVLYGAIIWRLQ